MLVEAFFEAILSVVTFIIGLLPTLEVDSGYEYVDAYIYPAFKAMTDIPIIGALAEVLTYIALFEVTLLAVRLAVNLFRALGILKHSPLAYD